MDNYQENMVAGQQDRTVPAFSSTVEQLWAASGGMVTTFGGIRWHDKVGMSVTTA